MLKTLEQTKELIFENKLLHIAGARELLAQLPKGNWVGGTTENFMPKGGGRKSTDILYVTELDSVNFKVNVYDTSTIENIVTDTYDNGYTILIMPFASEILKQYARNAPNSALVYLKPIIGWVAGCDWLHLEKGTFVFDDQTGLEYADKAVALHVELSADKTAVLNIVNIFKGDPDSPVIRFPQTNEDTVRCEIDGKPYIFKEYVQEHDIDIAIPLVAEYGGASINTSIIRFDPETDTTYFAAPIFNDVDYRFGKSLRKEYEQAFIDAIAAIQDKANVLSFNCIGNYNLAKLEGKDLGGFYGSVVFGEIAWIYLNQTLVYLQIVVNR
jgi:hypothetical protein